MNLYQLGQEYFEGSKKLRVRALEVMELLKKCEDPEERLLLKRRVYYLVTESRDCLETANLLMGYYNKEDENA